MIRSMAGDEKADLAKTDLETCAERFLTDAGMNAGQIAALKDRLTK